MAAATARTIASAIRPLMRCGLVAGEVMERNCSGENHYCSRDNEKGHRANQLPHALSLALTEGEPALRLHNFWKPIETDVSGKPFAGGRSPTAH